MIGWRRCRVFGVALMFLFFSAVLSRADEGNLAPRPLFRDPVHDGAADPVLVWDRAGNRWVMFYTNRRANVPGLRGVSWVHGTRIGMAESRDGGATWKYAGTSEFAFGQDDYTHWAPEIVEHRGTYHMYLSVVPGTFADWNAPRSIVHLTSTDLRQWQYRGALELGSDRVIDANVIRLRDGTWRMWYKNERDREGSLHYADSEDLEHWVPRGNAIRGVQGEGAKIFRWHGVYWMIVDVWDGLAVFRSEDALAWTRQPENLLREPGVFPTDRAKGSHADVVVSQGRAWLFYFTHQRGADAEGRDAGWPRHTVIQVAELTFANGMLACDRNQPVRIALTPPEP